MVIDAQATPLMAREVIRRIRRVTSKPVEYVVLSHYHAVRVLGASACKAGQIIASRRTLGLIRERGRQDMASEIGRFPICEHCMPFDVSRAYDEARAIKQPRIWTAQRDVELWKAIA